LGFMEQLETILGMKFIDKTKWWKY